MEEYIESPRRGKIRFYSAMVFIALCVAGMDMYSRYIENSDVTSSLTVEELVAESATWVILRGKVLVFLGVCMFLTFAYGAVVIPNMFEKMMNEYTTDKESTSERIQIYAGLPGYS
jgi:hypothetical protein